MAEIVHKFVVDYHSGCTLIIEYRPNRDHNKQTLIVAIDEGSGVVSFDLDAPDVKELVKFLQREVSHGKD